MATLFWFLIFFGGAIALAYRRASLGVFTASAGAALVAYTLFGSGGFLWNLVLWALFAGLVALNIEDFRRDRLTRPLLTMYRKMLPSMSRTEREALEAGTVWWEGELFAGVPRWDKLLGAPRAAAHGRRAGLSRRPLRRTLPHARRVGNYPRAPATCRRRRLGVPAGERLLRDDHPEELRRPRVLRLAHCQVLDQGRQPQRHGSPRRSPCPTPSARASCCCTTARRSRSSAGCPAWPAAARFPALR